MNAIFFVVMMTLQMIAGATGFTYNEINIILYYMLVPLVFAIVLDRHYGWHWIKVALVCFWGGALALIPNFREFCDWLFGMSVGFLQLFALVGVDYVAASVIVCVVLPVAALGAMLWCGRRRSLVSRQKPTPGDK